ncbi:MAG TPA: hypothetical protein VIL20_30825 [Sandaracinaceae bacterium]
MRASHLSLISVAALAACGASETAAPRVETVRAQVEPASAAEPRAEAAPAPPPEPAEPPAPPEPEPAEVEAGARLGAIRIGMTEAEVRALGLEESEVDPRSRRFGPYRVFFRDGVVYRVEAQMGALGAIRVAGETLPSGTHIHRIRDVIGSCEWYEGGGERYRCEGGTLFVTTTHSMDPARYTIAVERRR